MRLRTALLAVVSLVLAGLSLPPAFSAADVAWTSRLSGTVLGPDGPVPYAKVTPMRWVAPQPPVTTGGWAPLHTASGADDVEAETDAAGRYELVVPAGTYRLRVVTYDGSLAQQYYPSGTTVESGLDVSVAEGGTVAGLDVRLGPGGSLSGTVTGPDGVGLGVVYVRAYRVGDTAAPVSVTYVFTSPDGRYRLAGLPAGAYVVAFNDLQNRYATEYWPNAANAAAATPITVVAGAENGGIDEVMAAPSTAPPVVPTDTGVVRNITRPKVTGKPRVGTLLRVDKGVWAPATIPLSYRWLANGKPIAKARRAKLKVTRSLLGKRIAVEVTGWKMAWVAATVTTRATKRVRR
ncbi:carboxypeptidase-like regulatory domain-containing protein [Nocardioides sp. Soil805]|uniref:carboxypeptidase-like regulatory domain-containing protein n=1 Tax=Nocardioides sp. Soil805 TaxID=1736416 RepID=UPI0007035FE5|nr:carboxypeptidase-like regulatory domain-containing protein [Nocardioides sp. Soil805]KRF34832.1 hypothetical protein ASG94_11755 [Nocardioides sp. Soil805]